MEFIPLQQIASTYQELIQAREQVAALEAQIAQLIELQMSDLPPQAIDAIAKPERKEKAK